MTKREAFAIVTGLGLCLLGCDRQPEDTKNPDAAKPQIVVKPEEDSQMDQATKNQTTAEDVTRETREAAQTAADYSKQQAEKFRREVEDNLAKLDAKIETLKKRGTELSGEARQEWQAKMDRVSEKREAMESKLRTLQDASADAWDEIRQGVTGAWGDLETAYRKAAAEFENAEDSDQTSEEPTK